MMALPSAIETRVSANTPTSGPDFIDARAKPRLTATTVRAGARRVKMLLAEPGPARDTQRSMAKRIRIPDEDVSFSDSELEVLHTATFQRLFHMKQLGLAYLVYPGATHTRGAHSIQCLAEARKILAALRCEENDAESQAVRMAALLHDIGHLPVLATITSRTVGAGTQDSQGEASQGARGLGGLVPKPSTSFREGATRRALSPHQRPRELLRRQRQRAQRATGPLVDSPHMAQVAESARFAEAVELGALPRAASGLPVAE
jgi:hypothetical protein